MTSTRAGTFAAVSGTTTSASAEAGESRLARSAGTLSAGVGASGLLTYVYFSLSSHNLDSTSYGELVVLWSAVFVTIALLYRPVEHYVSRSVAEHRERGEAIGGTLRTAALLQGSIALGLAIVTLALRGPIEDELLSGNETLYWIYFAATLCFAASFFARGYLAGSQEFNLLAGLLVCESASRTLFAVALALGISEGQNAVALGIAAAPLFSLLVVPVAFRRRGIPNVPPASSASPPGAAGSAAGTGKTNLAQGGAFAGAVFWIMLAEQTLLSGGPLLVRGLEGAAAAGFIFNVLMLARAPLLVFQGISISLLPHLTRLRSRGDGASQAEFDGSIGQTLKAIVAFTAVVAVIVAVAGPTLMQLAFGDRFTYDRAGLLIVTVAMGLYLAATTLSQAALAQGRARRAATAWIACAATFLAWSAVPLIDEVDLRIELGFALAAGLLCAALARVNREPDGVEIGPAPGSADEISARLALADEAS